MSPAIGPAWTQPGTTHGQITGRTQTFGYRDCTRSARPGMGVFSSLACSMPEYVRARTAHKMCPQTVEESQSPPDRISSACWSRPGSAASFQRWLLQAMSEGSSMSLPVAVFALARLWHLAESRPRSSWRTAFRLRCPRSIPDHTGNAHSICQSEADCRFSRSPTDNHRYNVWFLDLQKLRQQVPL